MAARLFLISKAHVQNPAPLASCKVCLTVGGCRWCGRCLPDRRSLLLCRWSSWKEPRQGNHHDQSLSCSSHHRQQMETHTIGGEREREREREGERGRERERERGERERERGRDVVKCGGAWFLTWQLTVRPSCRGEGSGAVLEVQSQGEIDTPAHSGVSPIWVMTPSGKPSPDPSLSPCLLLLIPPSLMGPSGGKVMMTIPPEKMQPHSTRTYNTMIISLSLSLSLSLSGLLTCWKESLDSIILGRGGKSQPTKCGTSSKQSLQF